MAFLKAKKDKDSVKQGGSNHIMSSGIYPVTILAPIVNTSASGSTTIEMFLNHGGQEQVIYGNLRITNKAGVENKIGSKIFNQLMIIADVDEVADPVEVDLPIGKGGKDKTVAILEDLTDIDVLIRIQMSYSKYNGNIQERKEIKGFFRASDNATAEEIVNDSGFGEGFEKEQKYVNNITYQDDLDEETVAAWIAGGRQEGTGGTTAAKKAPAFGNKKRFGKDKEA